MCRGEAGERSVLNMTIGKDVLDFWAFKDISK